LRLAVQDGHFRRGQAAIAAQYFGLHAVVRTGKSPFGVEFSATGADTFRRLRRPVKAWPEIGDLPV
jgi:hypothetical protein